MFTSQLELFAPRLPPDVIVPCTVCGKLIVVQHFTEGHVLSEFTGENGECFKCEKPRKKKARTENVPSADTKWESI